MSERIVIVGGGVCGLACGAHLLENEPSCEVTIVEAEEQVGGLASLWRCGPYAADLGPHRIYTELPEIAALLPELIGEDQALSVERRSQLLLDGHYYNYPVQARELLRIMGPLRLGCFGVSALLGQIEARMRRPRHYADAMRQAFGKALYEKIIEPYTYKVWKTPPEQLSEEVARVRVSAGNTQRLVRRLLTRGDAAKARTALERFTYIRGGVEGLVEALRQRVLQRGGNIETGLRVTTFYCDGPSVTGLGASACSEEAVDSFFEATAVISTMPITDLAALLPTLSAESRAAADHLEFVGMVLVGVALAMPKMSPNTWLYFPEEHLVFNRAYEPKNFDPEMAPPDRTLAVFEVTARLDSALWQKSDREIAELVVHDGVEAGLFGKEQVLDVFTRRLPHAYPIYTVDFRKHLSEVCQGLARVNNLLSTGRQGLFNHNNMDHSMLMGIRAAETLKRHGSQCAQIWYNKLDQFSHFRIVD